MEYTTVEQDRSEIILTDGSRVYRIRTAVVAEGELPQLQIFLFEIQDEADPLADTFTRIASPADFETYEADRATAISNGDTYYLAGSFTRDFSDLETAKQAKDAILSRIDELTRTWFDYSQNFQATDELSSHPSVSPEFEQQLVDAYSDAKTARIAAEEAVEDATDAVSDAEDASEAAQDIVTIREEEVAFCEQAHQTGWNNYSPAVGTYSGAGSTFFSAMVAAYDDWATQESDPNKWPFPPSTGAYQAQRGDMYTAMDNYRDARYDFQDAEHYGIQIRDAFTAFCSTASVRYSAAIQDKQLKDDLVAEAVTAKKAAEAELAAAETAEAEALAALLAVCPDYDTSSI